MNSQNLSDAQINTLEAQVIEAITDFELAKNLMKAHQVDLINLLGLTTKFTVFSTIPCMFNNHIVNHYASYKIEDIKQINIRFLQIQFSRFNLFQEDRKISTFFSGFASVSIVLYYEQMKDTLIPYLLQVLSISDQNINKYALLYCDSFFSKVFDLMNQPSYKERFQKSIEDLITIFVDPVLQISISNIVNFSSLESIEVLNTILGLEDKKDFSKDTWIIHQGQNLKATTRPKQLFTNLWTTVLKADLSRTIIRNFLNPQINIQCFNITATMIFIINRYFQSEQQLITQIVGLINEYLEGAIANNFPIQEQFFVLQILLMLKFYLRYMMVGDVQLIENNADYQKFLQLMMLISQQYLTLKFQDQLNGAQENLLEFWGGFIINLRSQNYTQNEQYSTLLQLLFQSYESHSKIIENKIFKNNSKTVFHLWYLIEIFTLKLQPIIQNQLYQIKNSQNQEDQQLNTTIQSLLQWYFLVLFGSIRSTQFQLYVSEQFKESNGTRNFNHNEKINICTLETQVQQRYLVYCQNIDFSMKLVHEIMNNYEDTLISRKIIQYFWHKYAKYILLNRKKYLDIRGIYQIIYGEQYEVQVRQQIHVYINHVAQLIRNPSDQDSMKYAIKLIRMLSEMIPSNNQIIQIGLFNWDESILHPLFQNMQILPPNINQLKKGVYQNHLITNIRIFKLFTNHQAQFCRRLIINQI